MALVPLANTETSIEQVSDNPHGASGFGNRFIWVVSPAGLFICAERLGVSAGRISRLKTCGLRALMFIPGSLGAKPLRTCFKTSVKTTRPRGRIDSDAFRFPGSRCEWSVEKRN